MDKLDRNRCYFAIRVGESTTGTTTGKTYLLKYADHSGRWVVYDEYNSAVYSSNAEGKVFLNKHFWRVRGATAGQIKAWRSANSGGDSQVFKLKYKDEIMSDFVEKEEAIEVREGMLINGTDAAKFSDSAIIKMIGAERNKIADLKEAAGGASKYVDAKVGKMQESITKLCAILDSRV